MKFIRKHLDDIAWIMIFLIVLALLTMIGVSATSCTPTQRLNRLVKRHPELLSLKDTILVHDTVKITIPGINIDTTVRKDQLKDTIFINREFLHVKVWERNDTVFIHSNTDTIQKIITNKIKVPVEKIINHRPRDALRWYHYIFGSCFLIFIGLLILKRNKISNKSDNSVFRS